MSTVIYSKENKSFSAIDTEVYNQLKLFGLTNDEITSLFSDTSIYKIYLSGDKVYNELNLIHKLYTDKNFISSKFNEFSKYANNVITESELQNFINRYVNQLPINIFQVLHGDINTGAEALDNIKYKGVRVSSVEVQDFNRVLYIYNDGLRIMNIIQFLNHYDDKPEYGKAKAIQELMKVLINNSYKIKINKDLRLELNEWLKSILIKFINKSEGNDKNLDLKNYFKKHKFIVR